MTVARYTWEVVRGDDTTRIFIYKDLDGVVIPLTGYTANLEFTRAGVTTNYAGTIDAPLGKITVTIGDADTATWSSNGTFKLRLDNAGVKTTILVGTVEVIQ